MNEKNYEKRERKRAEAAARNEKWGNMTLEQKVASLEKRGHGHCKQAESLREGIRIRDEIKAQEKK